VDLTQLKRDIAMDRYAVDSQLVADAILRKLRLVRLARGSIGAVQEPQPAPPAAS
jgi:hypothetical protein